MSISISSAHWILRYSMGMSVETQLAVEFSAKIRAHALRMVHSAHGAHIGSSFSMADILSVLYTQVLRVDPARPDWPERDRLIVSKGHSAAILYAALAERDFFPLDWLTDYCKDGSKLLGHVSHHVPGVEVSTGSLGHGLPIGCGIALAAKRDGRSNRTFVILSDGELDEGSNWEAILFAGHNQLYGLVAIVDYNKIQSFGKTKDVLDLDPLAAKWEAFHWHTVEIDGHDFTQLENALGRVPFESGKPSAIIAHTVKGKGVSFMEDRLEWHYKSPDAAQLTMALNELGFSS
jgi:transketolase